MMKRVVSIVLACIIIFIVASCKKGSSGGPGVPDPDPPSETYSVKNKKEIFGFYGESRYSYCPTLIKESDGTVHMYFCGTQNMIMVDNIYHVKINPDGSQTPAKIILVPGEPGTWDDHHTCDPSVIKGEFLMEGTNYQYAMFFLSNAYGVYYNEIGVAFSNDPEAGSWVKYPHQIVKKTWSNDGDQMIGAEKAWGVGQPSAVSMDKKGKILLTYTIGDISGTRISWAEINLSNMNNYSPVAPVTMVREGLSNLTYIGNDVITNADFAIDRANNKIVIVRPVHPNIDNSYPTHIENAVEVASMSLDDFLASKGKWTRMARINQSFSGFARNHNPGIERNEYGEITNWKNPAIYYSVSKAEPDVNPSGTGFAEWTYHIWRAEVIENK